MIAYLIGDVADIGNDHVVLEVNHIGFNVKIPGSVLPFLPGIGEKVKIFTYTYVREDAFQLYGFPTQDDLDMFKLLITVNGIGPKGALGILSVLNADEVRRAVIDQDAKTIAKAPGIGSKTAQRLLLDLKDKIKIEELSFMKDSITVNGDEGLHSERDEAIEALTALGYSLSEASATIRKIPPLENENAEILLKEALKRMY